MILAFIAICGASAVYRALGVKVYWVALVLGLPVGLAVFVLFSLALRVFLPPPASAIGGAVGLLLFAYSFAIRRRFKKRTGELPPPDAPEPFGIVATCSLLGVVAIALFALRLGQLSGLSPDFCVTYPFFRAWLITGNNLQTPFFPALTYSGDLPYAELVSTLSMAVNGDVLRTEWILQAVLLIDAIATWALTLRFFLRRALPAALGTALLFGNALTPAFSGQTTMCYSEILTATVIAALADSYLTLMRYNRQHKETPPFASLTVGALTMFSLLICPWLTAFVWLSLVAVTAFYSYRRISAASVLGRSTLSITLYALLWGIPQILCWRQFNALWHQGELTLPHLNPKLFFINLPTTPFYFASSTAVSLFSKTSLLWHNIVFFIGLPLIAWALWRRSRKGSLLWLGGIWFFLWPGLSSGFVSPWQSELISDSFMAVLVGYALGDAYQLWSRHRSNLAASVQRLTLLVVMLCLTCGFWSNITRMYCDFPQAQARTAYIFLPWYPNTEDWLATIPQLHLTPEQTEISAFLWSNQEQPHRTLFAPDSLYEQSWASLALWAGQSGVIPLGFTIPQQNLNTAAQTTDLLSPTSGFANFNTIAPEPATLAFIMEPRRDVLQCIGAELVVCSSIPESASQTRNNTSNTQSATSKSEKVKSYSTNFTPWYRSKAQSHSGASLDIYLVASLFPWKRPLLPYPNTELKIEVSGLPTLEQRSGGVAYRVKVHTSAPLRGWLWTQWQDNTDIPTMGVYVEGSDAEVPLVFPYRDGNYKLSWLYCPLEKLAIGEPKDYSYYNLCLGDDDSNQPLVVERLTGTVELNQQFAAILENNLRLVKVEKNSSNAGTAELKNIGAAVLNCGENLHLQWQVWSPKKHGYLPIQGHQDTLLPLPLNPGASTTISWSCQYEIGDQDRVDFMVGSQYGELYPVNRM